VRRVAALLLVATSGCAFVGQGEGEVSSAQLSVPECWTGPFDLSPDFFASVPFRETQQIRVQRGSDIQEVSDGVAILVNDTPKIRDGLLGQDVKVGLPPKLLNEIAPGVATAQVPPDVSLALYLQFSCHNQNIVLYAVSGSIVFNSLFSGDPNEDEGEEKFTDAHFDVVVADPRDANPTDLIVPPEKTSPLTGNFRFHFQRGQPGQPFP
jgi:hypothetical protein